MLTNQVFLRQLSTLHSSPKFSDTVIISRGGARLPGHSLVMAAASSMMKRVFEEVQDKLSDTQFTILMPDHTQLEAAACLKSVYGIEETVTANNPFSVDFNIGDINSTEPRERDNVPSKPDLDFIQEGQKEATINAFIGHSILEEEPQAMRNPGKRKRGRPRKTRHGYLNDDFIDDIEDEWNEAPHFEVGEKPKKKRGRPKRIKEEDELEELEHYDHLEEMEETILEPIVKVKEEELERSFNEFNEFFSIASSLADTTLENQVSFNQDDMGLFQCEASGIYH